MLKNKQKRINPGSTDTLIGEGSKVEGNIASKASLRIEGQLVGDIECEGDVVIGEHGKLQSHIQARNVYNAGWIEGSVHTKGILSISSSGQVHGDIKVRSLSIAEGGLFQGSSQMAPQVEAVQLEADQIEEKRQEQSGAKQKRKTLLQKIEKNAANK